MVLLLALVERKTPELRGSVQFIIEQLVPIVFRFDAIQVANLLVEFEEAGKSEYIVVVEVVVVVVVLFVVDGGAIVAPGAVNFTTSTVTSINHRSRWKENLERLCAIMIAQSPCASAGPPC